MAQDKPLRPLTEINRIIAENRIADYSSPNLTLGMRPEEFGRGTSRWIWDNQLANVLNPFGTIQGGYLALFIDELFITAIASVLEEGEFSVTAEMKVSYLRAQRPGMLRGVGKVVRRTKALAFLEAQVLTAEGAEVALASSTWAISRG